MKAFVVSQGEAGPRFELTDLEDPTPGPNDLLVVTRSAGLNRADLLPHPYRFGHSPDDASAAAGIEVAGEVEAMGEQVVGFRLGERVAAMAIGAFAQLALVDYRLAMKLPMDVDWDVAAVFPVAYLTAHDALTSNGDLQPGESVLVRGASSAVGVATMQVARAKGARPVLGTSRDPAKLERLVELGFDHAFLDDASGVARQVRMATGERGADIVVDQVGASVFQDNLAAMAVRGRLVSVGRLGGGAVSLDLDRMAVNRHRLVGVTFRTRTIEEHAQVVARFAADLLPEVAAGRLRPVIDKVFPFAEAPAALAHMRANAAVGKIVLSM